MHVTSLILTEADFYSMDILDIQGVGTANYQIHYEMINLFLCCNGWPADAADSFELMTFNTRF